MAIKILRDAGFNKEDHILTLIHRGPETLAEVRVKDQNGAFVTFTNALPVATALDVIRRSHNADVINGKNLGRMMHERSDENIAALARVYLVEHLI